MKRLYIYIALVVIALIPWFLDSGYIFHIAAMTSIMIPMALGMNLLLKIGQLSLAQAAFMGIGAYATALLSIRLDMPPMLALLFGGLIAALIATVVGPLFLRIKGVFFVLLTFAFGEIVYLLFQEWTSLFGGNSGLYGIPGLTVLGIRLASAEDYFIVGTVFSIATYTLMRGIERSDIGAIMESLNEDEMFSKSIGNHALAWRTAVFVISAFFTGVAGGIYAFYIGFLSPDAFSFQTTVDLIVMNVIGGVTAVIGAVLGAIVIVPLPELLRDTQEYELLIYGVCIIVFLLFQKQGLAALIERNGRARK